MISFIRIILTALLIYGAYTETGVYTTLVLILIALKSELQCMFNSSILRKLK